MAYGAGAGRYATPGAKLMWQRIRWAWLVARYGAPLARAWIALENFERIYGGQK